MRFGKTLPSRITPSPAPLRSYESREPRYIATVHTIGYRFLCDVKVTEDHTGCTPQADLAADGAQARISPDGSFIALFRLREGRTEIWLVHSDGEEAHRIVSGSAGVHHAGRHGLGRQLKRRGDPQLKHERKFTENYLGDTPGICPGHGTSRQLWIVRYVLDGGLANDFRKLGVRAARCSHAACFTSGQFGILSH